MLSAGVGRLPGLKISLYLLLRSIAQLNGLILSSEASLLRRASLSRFTVLLTPLGSPIGFLSFKMWSRMSGVKVQKRMFDLLNISDEEAQELFGHLLKALSHGAPPHGGFAIGYDRLCALMVDGETIREVIAFPKNHRGVDLMMEAPSHVADKQLRDVHLQLSLPPEV